MQRRLRAVILDLDGGLVDSTEAHAEVWLQVLREDGIEADLEKLTCTVGIGPDQFLPAAAGIAPDTQRGRRLMARHEAIFRERCLPKLSLHQDVPALLDRMRTAGLKLIAYAPCSPQLAEELGRIVGFQNIVSGERPLRVLLESALETLGTYPIETLLLTDTPFDIEAGLRIGVQAIAFRTGGWMNDSLEGALAIYDDPHELLENFEPSPLGFALMGKAA